LCLETIPPGSPPCPPPQSWGKHPLWLVGGSTCPGCGASSTPQERPCSPRNRAFRTRVALWKEIRNGSRLRPRASQGLKLVTQRGSFSALRWSQGVVSTFGRSNVRI
ncbi:hypothetical protein CMEL01_14729, partial [Colletotrichum melonis]